MVKQLNQLPVTIREFIHKKDTSEKLKRFGFNIKPHVDFEYKSGPAEQGIVKSKLKGDKPEFAGGRKKTVNSRNSFSSWYVDDPEYNIVTTYCIDLEEHPTKERVLRPKSLGNPQEVNEDNFRNIDPRLMFFPLDNLADPKIKNLPIKPQDIDEVQKLLREGLKHNYHFTTETPALTMKYRGDEFFTFIGDDDLWVFLDGKLVIDLGGTHIFLKETLDLKANVEEDGKKCFKKNFFGQTLKLVEGEEYEFRLFHAERHTERSFFYFETTFEFTYCPPTVNLLTPDSEATEPSAAGEKGDPGKFKFVLAEQQPLEKDLEIEFLVEGKAKEGGDYISFGRSIILPAGQTSIEIPVIPLFDKELEDTEDVVVTLQDSKHYLRGMPFKGTVWIKNYKPEPCVSVVASIPEAAEPGFGQVKKNGEFTIYLTEPSFQDLDVAYTITGSAVSGLDYDALSGTVTVPKGVTEVKIPVVPIKDKLKEGDETVILELIPPQDPDCYKLTPETTKRKATVTIVDVPCPIVCVEVSASPAIEPCDMHVGQNGEFIVKLDRPAWKTLTINAKVGGSAVSGKDYQSIQVPITIPKDEMEVKIPVIPLKDQVKDDDETVILTLESGEGYELCLDEADRKAVVIILDDCAPPCAGVTAPKPNAKEPCEGKRAVNGQFTIYLNRAAHKDITVHYDVLGTATSGKDYTPLSGSVVIPKGKISADITVVPKGDKIREKTETVILSLKASPTNDYELKPSYAKTRAIVKILDCPPIPTVSIFASKPVAIEPGFSKKRRDGEFTIQLDSPYPGPRPLKVQYKVTGTARPNVDYVKLGSAEIQVGQKEVKLPVEPLEDQSIEPDETVVVTLSDAAEYKLHQNPNRHSAVVKIVDCPPIEVEIKATKKQACEAREAGDEAPRGDWGQFLITLSEPAPKTMKIEYGISGSADPGKKNDYLLKDEKGRGLGDNRKNNKITCKKGTKKLIINVVPLGDRDYTEKDETVICKLEDGKGYIVGRKDEDTVKIKPDRGTGIIGGDRRE